MLTLKKRKVSAWQPTLQLKELEQEKQTKHKDSGRKEIIIIKIKNNIKIIDEIKKLENRKNNRENQ